jgi:hypothetical protein
MSKFEAFFEQYVYGLMLPDVSREIVRASRDENTANFLCALGLLCYTEALGHWVPEAKKGSRNKFEAFFRRLGPLYAEFLDNGEDPWKLYRNTLAHSFEGEKSIYVGMLNDPVNPPPPCGVRKDEDGVYMFGVEQYFRDFVVACARLYKELVGHRHHLIHIYALHSFPYAAGPPNLNADLV